MAQISNGESGLSARNKLNEVIDKIEGNSAIGNDIEVTGTVTMDGGSTSADFTFGDNDKAIFGAGSDLQIYHDSSASYVSEQGVGPLNLLASQLNIYNASQTSQLAQFNTTSSKLFHDNAAKLTTTSTGVDITGTLTSDGLTVDGTGDLGTIGNGAFNAAAALGFQSDRAFFGYSSSQNALIQSGASKGVVVEVDSDTLDGGTRAALFASNGDISFYEDTGTTAKFNWSAADEKLEIGSIQGGADGLLAVKTNANNHAIAIEEASGVEAYAIGVESDGSLGFYNSGSTTASVTFDDSGNVGIGTSSPSATLNLSGGGNAIVRLENNSSSLTTNSLLGSTQFYSNDPSGLGVGVKASVNAYSENSTGSAYYMTFNTTSFSGSNDTERLRIDSSGNVGIGTSSPSYRLDLGTVSNGTTLFNVTNGSNSNLRFKIEDGVSTIMNTGSSAALAFTSGGTTERMRITSAGRVGIGKSSPDEELDIYASVPTIRLSDSDGSYSRVAHNTASMILQADEGGVGTGSMRFDVGGSEAMRINSIGNVGIGTSSPDDKLHVTDNIRIEAAFPTLRFKETDTTDQNYQIRLETGSLRFQTNNDAFAAASEAMRITSAGDLLVGTTDTTPYNNNAGTSADQGFVVSGGRIYAATNGNSVSILNRTSTDGDIIQFRKNGTTVGSIGTYGGDLDIGTDDTVIRFNNGIDAIFPVASVGGVGRDNAVDLGFSGARFKDLYLSGTVNTDSVSTASADLTAIAKDISDTAVDVFVYDTSKDSDGGAWRKRTQGTSWYNETLNTATRGSRKEFPAVAVIVAESNQVTIYDGDDPDLPMWMVFNSTSGSMLRSGSITGMTMLQGTLAVCHDAGSGFHEIYFLKDTARWLTASTAYGGYYLGGEIANRNTGGANYYNNVSGASDLVIANSNVNDVAMTVLPNAPLDAATGLPVPTIAVATGGGVSVIKDDGTVVDSASTSVYYSVMFNGSDLYAEDTTFADDTQYYGDVGSLSDSFPTFRNFYSYSASYERLSSSVLSAFSGNILTKLGTPRSFAVGLTADTSSNASWTALNMVAGHSGQNGFATRTALVSYINSSFNTGWMNGDIKLSTLSDTDDTDVTGSELVTNGTFDSDVSGWTAVNAVVSWDASGYLVVDDTANAGSDSRAYQDITTVVNETYVLSFDKISTTSAFWFGIGSASNIGSVYYSGSLGTSTGPHSKTFVATETTTRISMISSGAGVTKYDNVSVRLAEEDRSVNGNGLQVFGTVTKNPVATGADLVGYSGFSTSNYLEQPYNSDLDFGTGDFCYMGWFKTSSNGITMFERCASPRSGNGMTVYMDGTGKAIWYKIVSGTPTIVVTPTAAYNNNTWVHFAVIRQNGIVSLYFNGQKDGSASDSTDMNNTSAVFRLGANATATSGWTGSLALWRISATAPSPEQIAKIYEDEKVLFQENAQATLYGSSDAVTALAYDDTTELLHVGTSAGRSVFQGLRRVDNTTDAVGAAISASNGLVAED
jgi:hypothetical protein